MTNPSTDSCFVSTPGGGKIILLDLQGTLALPPRHDPPTGHIEEVETYKEWLISALPTIQEPGWEVHLFTVRNVDRREVTLQSIKVKTGPDCV